MDQKKFNHWKSLLEAYCNGVVPLIELKFYSKIIKQLTFFLEILTLCNLLDPLWANIHIPRIVKVKKYC